MAINYHSYSARPIEPGDKGLILRWRNSPRVRDYMYSDHVISRREHNDWFAKVLVNPKVSYVIFSHNLRPLGLISFVDINKQHNWANWAFYLGEDDAPRGAGSAMEFFALDQAFLTLEIRKLCCEVFSFNKVVIRLHEKFGFIQEGILTKHYLKNGKFEDVVCLARFGDSWLDEREELKKRIFGTDEA